MIAGLPYLRQIANAVAYQAVKGNLVPNTVLAAGHPATVGDTGVVIDPVLTGGGQSRIVKGGVFRFWDATPEEDLTIQDVSADGATVTFDFSGKPNDGLLHDHPAGTTVASNAYGWELPPDAMAALLQHGDPLVVCFCRHVSWTIEQGDMGLVNPLIMVTVNYIRQLYRPNTAPRPTAADWGQKLDFQLMSDVPMIVRQLLQEPDLTTDYDEALIEQLGNRGGGGATVDVPLDNVDMNEGTWRYGLAFSFLVTGLPDETAP